MKSNINELGRGILKIYWLMVFSSIQAAHAGMALPFAHKIDDIPRDVVVDSSGNIYTFSQPECIIYKFTQELISPNYWKKEVFAGTHRGKKKFCPGFSPGKGTSASFGDISALAIDANDHLYVIDGGVTDYAAGELLANPAIVKITPSGTTSELIYTEKIGGALSMPANQLAIDSLGNLYLSSGFYIDRIISDGKGGFSRELFVGDDRGPAGGSCFLFKPGRGGGACFGSSSLAGPNFGYVQRMAFDEADNLYLGIDNAGVIAKINPLKDLSLFAGSPYKLGNNDGMLAHAKFNQVAGIFYQKGQLYVADGGMPSYSAPFPLGGGTIRKIDFDFWNISTLAGVPAKFGNLDGIGPMARFGELIGGMAVTPTGTIFVSNSEWGEPTNIRIISSTGAVSTLMGMEYWCEDGKPC